MVEINEDMITECESQIISTSVDFIESIDGKLIDGESKVKVTVKDLLNVEYLKWGINGFEIFAMGEPGKVVNWSSKHFGNAINTLVAKYFGDKVITLKDWVDASNRACGAWSGDGYKLHTSISVEIIEKYINNIKC